MVTFGAALAVAVAFWSAHGIDRAPACGVVNPLPMTQEQLESGAAAVPTGTMVWATADAQRCAIDLGPDMRELRKEADPDYCKIVVHEYGHLLGLPHSRRFGGVMRRVIRWGHDDPPGCMWLGGYRRIHGHWEYSPALRLTSSRP